MKNQKVISVLLGAFAVTSMLTACGSTVTSNSGTAPSTNTSSGASENVTLTYAFWSEAQKPAMDEIAKKFEELHPNIHIKTQLTPSKEYWTQLEAGATGGQLPDVFWMTGPDFIKYASNNVLLPITDLIKKDNVDLNNYPKPLLDLYTYKGDNYALPKDFDTVGLFYNKELFDKAGIKYPDDTWDWNKLLEAAQKLTDPSKGVWGIAAELNGQEDFYDLIFQNGGYVISDDKKSSGYDKPETIQALKFWTDMIHKYKVSPTLAQMTDTSTLNLFSSGKLAMLYAGSFNQVRLAKNEFIKGKFDVAVLPKGKERATVIHGLGNVIAKSTSHPKEAWEFVKFLGSKDAADIEAKTGAVIPAYKGTQDAWVKSFPQYHVQAFLDMLPYAKPYPSSKDTGKWMDLQTKYFTKAWNNEMSIEDASKEVAKQMNSFLAQE